MTATMPSRLDQVAEMASMIGRRPTSNEVRRLLNCGRDTANRLLAELDGPPAATGPEGTQIARAPGGDQQEATGANRATGQASGPPLHRGWLLLLALPAFVAVWGGWVGLGGLAGFGPVELLPGIFDHLRVNLAVTLPAGMECYAVIGLRVWLSTRTGSDRTRRFAAWSTCTALGVGCLGQVVYHVLARPTTGAPMVVTVFVACLPVAVLGLGAALFHLVGEDQRAATK
jgi:hypothetical protein